MHHKLKILPSFYKAVVSGSKKFEIRDNSDRGFQCGDTVTLQEFSPEENKIFQITGKSINVKITYVSDYLQPQNQVVFCFDLIDKKET
jgi:uncharacterized protein YqfB (UPF0267 family)